MNRIPTEGLKLPVPFPYLIHIGGLNEQNPDRGIETAQLRAQGVTLASLNEQNPDRGIETSRTISLLSTCTGLNEQNPDRGIETDSAYILSIPIIALE